MRFFVGGYTQDIRLVELDATDSAFRVLATAETPANASFLAWVPQTGMLYATVETGSTAADSGGLAAYRLYASGALTLVSKTDSCGAAPCHLAVDAGTELVVAANYTGGSVTAVALHDDGTFAEQLACVQHQGSGPVTSRQEAAHAHSAHIEPHSGGVYVCDLGTDTIQRYELAAFRSVDRERPESAAGTIAMRLSPGSGPRHIAFSDDSRHAYVITELANTVIFCEHDIEQGILTQLQELPLLPGTHDGGALAAEIALHPSGKFLYASVRGPDRIVVFERDASRGLITPAGSFSSGGSWPRHLHLTHDGDSMLVANERSDRVCLFTIDSQSGIGIPAKQFLDTPAPSCVIPL